MIWRIFRRTDDKESESADRLKKELREETRLGTQAAKQLRSILNDNVAIITDDIVEGFR